MLRKYQNMFLPISQQLEDHAIMSCLTTHPTLQAQWRDELQDITKMVVDESEHSATEEIQNFLLHGVERFLEKATNKRWRDLSAADKLAHVKKILDKPQVAQRTADWYLQAQRMITASEFASLYASERQYANLVISKALPPTLKNSNSRLACPTEEMGPFDWGIRFEPVVKQIFEKRWGVQIFEAGRITHPIDTRLAASPDGILSSGQLLEIKCPISREIGGTLPFEYWCQMQIQMEVTDIDECEYIEVRLEASHPKKMKFTRPDDPIDEGVMWLLNKEHEFTYVYTMDTRITKELEGWSVYESIPWCLLDFHHITLQRDRQWFNGTADIREKFWKNVEEAKAGTFKAPPPTTPRAKACLIQDSPPQESKSFL
jgi:hypothetical protein